MTESTPETLTQESETASLVPPEKANVPLTPHQLENLRLHLYNSVVGEYKKMIELVKSLPFPPQATKRAFDHLDDGMLWVKEAIFYAPFMKEPHFVKQEGSEEG